MAVILAGCGAPSGKARTLKIVEDSRPRAVLVEDGRPRAIIVLPAEAHEFEQLAADELVAHVKTMSGATLAIVTAGQDDAEPGTTRILLGKAAAAVVGEQLLDQAIGSRRDSWSCRDGFVIKVTQTVVAIRGVRQTGTLYGVYALLDQLGCRWFWPGELGTVVPKRATIAVAPMQVVDSPTFDMRQMWFSGDHAAAPFEKPWGKRNRLSLDYGYNSGHSQLSFWGDADQAEKMANAYLTVLKKSPNQKRLSLSYGDTWYPINETEAMGVRHPWGHENFPWARPGIYQSTDELMKFYRQVVERVEVEYPDVTFGFLTYNNYFAQPFAEKVHPALSPMVAPIEQCARHAPGTGRCWQRDATFKIISNWCDISPGKVFIYDYEPGFINMSHSVPAPGVTRLRVEMPLMAKLGVRGILQQSIMSVMNQGPNLWIRAKLMWDAHADVDDLLDEYYSKLYGRAGQSVRKYWNALEHMMHNGPGHRRQEIIKTIYPVEKVRKLERHVAAAERSADTDMIRRRVQVIRWSYDNLVQYLRMSKSEDDGRFAEAARIAQSLVGKLAKIDQADTVLYKVGDMDRYDEFHSHLIGGRVTQNEELAAMTDGSKGDLVALLADKWTFRTDPHDEGMIYEWYARDLDTRKWGTIRTTRTWDLQGLEDKAGHMYDGLGWYRTHMTVPARFAGKKIFLHFSGRFGKMLIWVNGRFAAYRTYPKFRWVKTPDGYYEIDVSDLVTPGKQNVIAIRVDNSRKTGGIYRRVFAWSPRAKADQ